MNRTSSTVCLTLFLVTTGSLPVTSSEALEDSPHPGATHLGEPTVTIEMNLESGRPMIDLMVDGKGPFLDW